MGIAVTRTLRGGLESPKTIASSRSSGSEAYHPPAMTFEMSRRGATALGVGLPNHFAADLIEDAREERAGLQQGNNRGELVLE
jgi:hypothetical protein